jgi:RNase H-like domain found in reverse transcriptase
VALLHRGDASFIGPLQLLPLFRSGVARILYPTSHNLRQLNDALQSSLKLQIAITWSEEKSAALTATKAALLSNAWLHHPLTVAGLALLTDASATHIGVTLQQHWQGQSWQALVFSQKLVTAE